MEVANLNNKLFRFVAVLKIHSLLWISTLIQEKEKGKHKEFIGFRKKSLGAMLLKFHSFIQIISFQYTIVINPITIPNKLKVM